MTEQKITKYSVIIPFYGYPFTKNGIIYIPLDYLEKHFTEYGINKETVFKHIFEHEKLHIAKNHSVYPGHIILTIREFKKYANHLRKVDTEALPSPRFDNDEEFIRLNEICMKDLEVRIERSWEKFLIDGKLILKK